MEPIVKHIEHDFDSYDGIMRNLCRQYPFLKPTVIGKSVFGRSIKALSIGEAETCTLYTAAIHGNERITATVLLRFIEELCFALSQDRKLADVNIKRALEGKCAVFIPLANPDGCEISLKGASSFGVKADWAKRISNGRFDNWKANLRGVDLNHNFDAGWEQLHKTEQKNGIFRPSPAFYGGPKPHSEPETAALVKFCQQNTVRYLMTLHTQGEVIYWDYNNIPTLRGRRMAEIFAASSGYALDVPNALSLGGGFKDWFIESFRRPGFTIELGRGTNPLPAELGSQIYETVKEMLTIGLLM